MIGNSTEKAEESPKESQKGQQQKQKDFSSNRQLGFRFVWSVRVVPRRLGPNGENTILHISPKFSTVYEHISFQWTLKMYGTPEMGEEGDEEEEGAKEEENAGGERTEEEGDKCSFEKSYVAISLYYLDGPMSTVDLKAKVRIVGERRNFDDNKTTTLLEERNDALLSVFRGHECEIAFKDRAHLTEYIRHKIGLPIWLSLLLEMDAHLFRTDTYLNVISPTPYHSFLTANYRARIGSKVWRKRSNRKARSASDGHSLAAGHKKMDLETVFNKVLEQQQQQQESGGGQVAGRRESALGQQTSKAIVGKDGIGGGTAKSDHSIKTDYDNCGIVGESAFPQPIGLANCCALNTQPNILLHPSCPGMPNFRPSDLFKKLLVACCDSCERRASLITVTTAIMMTNDQKANDDERGEDVESGEDGDGDDGDGAEEEENTFECDEENKTEMHDTLANMYFNSVVLPEMEYVEDFVDFLIDAELSDLPVLKRACERYLCGELDSKNELMTSLILDFFFIAMVFTLPVMKSMTLTELCERFAELEDVDKLLAQEEYRNVDKRIRQICGERNLHDLVDECKRFREQCMRVQKVELNKDKMSEKGVEGILEKKQRRKTDEENLEKK